MDIQLFWRAVLEQDEEAIRPFFHPQAKIKWVCTNEEFTVDEFITANCQYPGDWDGEVERTEQMGDTLVTVTRVWPMDAKISFHVASFFCLCEDKILTLEEYWADDGPPPTWRQEMNIGRPIR